MVTSNILNPFKYFSLLSQYHFSELCCWECKIHFWKYLYFHKSSIYKSALYHIFSADLQVKTPFNVQYITHNFLFHLFSMAAQFNREDLYSGSRLQLWAADVNIHLQSLEEREPLQPFF